MGASRSHLGPSRPTPTVETPRGASPRRRDDPIGTVRPRSVGENTADVAASAQRASRFLFQASPSTRRRLQADLSAARTWRSERWRRVSVCSVIRGVRGMREFYSPGRARRKRTPAALWTGTWRHGNVIRFIGGSPSPFWGSLVQFGRGSVFLREPLVHWGEGSSAPVPVTSVPRRRHPKLSLREKRLRCRSGRPSRGFPRPSGPSGGSFGTSGILGRLSNLSGGGVDRKSGLGGWERGGRDREPRRLRLGVSRVEARSATAEALCLGGGDRERAG